MKLRETIGPPLFSCLDDTHDLVSALYQAKQELIAERDPTFELRTAESKLNKVIENFNLIIKEIDSAQKNPKTDGTLP